MKRSAWIHQFSQLSEQTPQEIAATLLPRGITAVYPKAMDGTDWMSRFYSHPLAPSSRQHLAELIAQFAEVGLELTPWVVPRSSAEEADVHAVIADRVIIDWEYQYAGFWLGSHAQAVGYFNQLRNYVLEGQWVAVAPDPRQPGRDYEVAMIAGLSAYLPQTYWTDFQRDVIDVLQAARSAMAGLDPFEPILPSNSTPSDMQAGLDWCAAAGCQAVSLWRMGTANADQLDAFAQKVDGEEPEEPMPDCDYGWQDKKPLVVNLAGELAGDVTAALLAEANRKGGPRVKEVRRLATAEVKTRADRILA